MANNVVCQVSPQKKLTLNHLMQKRAKNALKPKKTQLST